MNDEHADAIRVLIDELLSFLDSGATSIEGELRDPEWEMLNQGGTIYAAVIVVEKFYGGKLPSPVARVPWRRLLRIDRSGDINDSEQQNLCHEYAEQLKQWAESQLLAKRSPEGNENDGPFPPNGIRWKTIDYSGLRPMGWKLIDYLWNRRNRTAHYDDLAREVWGDHAIELGSSQIDGVKRDTNNFFRKHAIPLYLQSKGKHLSLLHKDRAS